MSILSRVISITLFVLVSALFLPLVGLVHIGYAPWEKWFENITKF